MRLDITDVVVKIVTVFAGIGSFFLLRDVFCLSRTLSFVLCAPVGLALVIGICYIVSRIVYWCRRGGTDQK